jgi:glycerophosphoryl diester phosphodiesterase
MPLIPYLKNAGIRPVIGGHRGHTSDIRENTIRNFCLLDKERIPYIEIDVQLTKDAHPVVFHDPDLRLTTSLSGAVRDHTLAQLRADFEINTVPEVLNWAKTSGMGIAFELKLYPDCTQEERSRIAEELAREIRLRDGYEDCFVFGKDYGTLRQIRSLDPKIPIGIIAPDDPREAFSLMEELGAILYLDWLSGFTKELVDRLHACGYLADGSVVDTPEGVRRAMELGLDMIESNFPESMLAARDI